MPASSFSGNPFVRLLLLPVSWGYGGLMVARNMFFDVGILRAKKTTVPVISIGNLTAGGTGKTPLVEYVLQRFLSRQVRVAVLSRGYGRQTCGVQTVSDGRLMLADATTGGDEPVQIAQKFPEAIMVVAERRLEGADVAIGDHGAQVLLLDDGFQHRYIHRDVNVVVIDGRFDLLAEPMIPAGVKREPNNGLKRADVILVSNWIGDRIQERNLERITRYLDKPVSKFRYSMTGIFEDGKSKPLPSVEFRNKRFFAFSGIAGHPGFLKTLRDSGVKVIGDKEFPDHHDYTIGDLEEITLRANETNADTLITSEKDIVRLGSIPNAIEKLKAGSRLFFIRIAVEFVDGEQPFLAMIDRVIKKA